MVLLSSIRPLSAMVNGETLVRPVYLKYAEDRMNNSNKVQLMLTVKDGVSTETVSIFDTDLKSVQERFPFVVPGNVVIMTISKKDPYFNARNVFKTAEEDFDLTEIAEKATEKNPECYYNYILNKVHEVARNDGEFDPIANIVDYVYDKRKCEILRSSSAMGVHHTGLYGNVVHTSEVMSICVSLLGATSAIRKDIDAELLLTGAALHDVGKIDCYATDDIGTATMTMEGYAVGHHYRSLLAVEEAVREGNYDPERVMLLKNMIASHHGNRQFGDLENPLTLEAIWLHFADDLDAKHDAARKAILEATPGAVTSKKVYPFEHVLYRRSDQ